MGLTPSEWLTVITVIVSVAVQWGLTRGRITGQEITLKRHENTLAEHDERLTSHDIELAQQRGFREGFDAAKTYQKGIHL